MNITGGQFVGVVLGLGINYVFVLQKAFISTTYIPTTTNPTNMDLFVISLAVCDILKALVGYTLEIHFTTSQWNLSRESCQTIGFSVSFFS